MRYLVGALAAVVLIAPVASAQTDPGPAADLSLTLQGPAATPLVGQTFEVVFTVTNEGPSTASQAVFYDYLSPELEMKTIASSDPSDTCGTEEPSYPEAQAPPAEADSDGKAAGGGTVGSRGGGGGFNCQLGDMAAGETATITVVIERVGAREVYNSGWVGSNNEDVDYNDNYAELFLDADKSNPADVGVTLATSEKTPEIGGTFSFIAEVTNNGPSVADSVTLVDSFYEGVDFGSATPSRAGDVCEVIEYPGYSEPGSPEPAYGGYTEVECRLAPLEPGASATFDFAVTRSSAWEIYNSAWVMTSTYDENYENDYAFASVPADPSVTSDLWLKMAGPATTPLVGDTFDITITVGNDGPSAAGDVWVSDYLPGSLEFVSATPADRCSFNEAGPYPMAKGPETDAPKQSGDAYYPIWGNGLFCDIGAVGAGETSTVTVTVTRVSAWEAWNSSWVSSSNFDPNYENNYSDSVIEADKSNPVDLSLQMTAAGEARCR